MPVELPREWLEIAWGLLGLVVGSFLNVAVHRLPLQGESVSHPRRSRCPSCRTTLTWRENIPLVSWIVQRGRCRTCGWRIPWRYPLVEALNGFLWWFVAAQSTGGGGAPLVEAGVCLARSIVLSGLIVATFVDFDCFEIPDEISIGGMFLAPLASLALPALHEETRIALALTPGGMAPVTRLGALTGCLAGMLAGGGILWIVGRIGSRVYGRDAMGFGDVKLLAAGGGFVGPGGVLWVLMIASLVASIAGVANILRFACLLGSRHRARHRKAGWRRTLGVARAAGRYVPFGPYLALGIGIVLLGWSHVAGLLRYGAL